MRHKESKEEIQRLEDILKLIPQIVLALEEETTTDTENSTLVELFSRMTELGDLPEEVLATLSIHGEEETHQQCAQQ